MQEPKQNAVELVDKYYHSMNPNAPDCNISYNQAKQCALICVEEILEAVTTIADKKYDYWQSVKQEIINL